MPFKKIMTSNKTLIFLALLFASLVSAAMVVARFLYGGDPAYLFLIWNLFLAWMPLIFALLAYLFHRQRIWPFVWGFLWLLFFPNALYIVTDLLHLRPTSSAPFWYDAIMIFSFALTGLFLGFLSLYLMQSLVVKRFGSRTGWLFAVVALGLSSFGVYVGRFLRWNSWDIFTNPLSLLADILNNLIAPHLFLRTYVMSLLLSAIFTFAYVILFSLPRLHPDAGTRG